MPHVQHGYFFSFNQSHYCFLAKGSVRSHYFCSSNRLFLAVGIYVVATHPQLLSKRLARCSKAQCWDPSLKQRKSATKNEIQSKLECFIENGKSTVNERAWPKGIILQTSLITFGHNSIPVCLQKVALKAPSVIHIKSWGCYIVKFVAIDELMKRKLAPAGTGSGFFLGRGAPRRYYFNLVSFLLLLCFVCLFFQHTVYFRSSQKKVCGAQRLQSPALLCHAFIVITES